MSETTRPKVSVCMVTYRHSEFIEQAIGSVMSQAASFPIELVVGDDASPDDTAEKIRRFASTQRVQMRPLFHQSNLGAARNFVTTLAECRGEYVALLEGDDYWTDPLKLQRQVDFLDSHPGHS